MNWTIWKLPTRADKVAATNGHGPNGHANQPVDRIAIGATSEVLKAELVSRRFLEKVPRDFARQHLLISQGDAGGVPPCERIIIAATTNPAALFNVGVHLGRGLETLIGDEHASM